MDSVQIFRAERLVAHCFIARSLTIMIPDPAIAFQCWRRHQDTFPIQDASPGMEILFLTQFPFLFPRQPSSSMWGSAGVSCQLSIATHHYQLSIVTHLLDQTPPSCLVP